MTLPPSYSYHSYFEDAFSFFSYFKYIYNFANVDVLNNNILEFKRKWQNITSHTEHEKFYSNLNKLTSSNLDKEKCMSYQSGVCPNIQINKGLSTKKQHEIDKLSSLISDTCSTDNISLIIDFGCGLGYLSFLLYEKYKYRILGVEGDEHRVALATNRQEKLFNTSIGHVNFVHHFITSDSVSFLNECIKNQFDTNENFLITGLHACGDLTIDAIRLFLMMDRCKGIVIMPCCYHKMKSLSTDKNETDPHNFLNIPLSDAMKSAYVNHDGSSFIRRPFLRLSCQRTIASWELKKHEDERIFHLMSRAILQQYAFQESLKLVKKRRKAVKKSTIFSFEAFLEETVAKAYELRRIDDEGLSDNVEFNYEKIRSIWNDLTQEDFDAVKELTKLQDSLQSLCENVVLLDKVAYIQEQKDKYGIDSSFRLVKVTDDVISPRCYAFVATK